MDAIVREMETGELPLETLKIWLGELETAIASREHGVVVATLKNAVPEYKPDAP